jgi:cytidine deaminase
MGFSLDQALIDAAVDLANTRYPHGEAVVAALRTATGKVLTSVSAEARVDSACLCAETGAICEAHKIDEAVVASVCLYRQSEDDELRVLPACGICQERLAFWGLDVEVAVPDTAPGRFWQSRTLRKLRPFYWDEPAG